VSLELSTLTIKSLDEKLTELSVPIDLFKQMIHAVMTDDFSQIEDSIIQIRYKVSYEKVYKHISQIIYQDIYAGSVDYTSFIEILVKIYAVFDTLIEGRRRITDIQSQSNEVVEIFLDSYGFSIYIAFDNDIKKEIARNVYFYLRRKGTPYIIEILLNHMGYTHFKIDEYLLTKHKKKWMFIAEPIYKSAFVKNNDIPTSHVSVEELDDPLWWLDDDELNNIYTDDLYHRLT